MIPVDLLSACPHRQFHTLPGLLDSQAALPNSYPNACVPMQGGSFYHFYDGLSCDPTRYTATYIMPAPTKRGIMIQQEIQNIFKYKFSDPFFGLKFKDNSKFLNNPNPPPLINL